MSLILSCLCRKSILRDETFPKKIFSSKPDSQDRNVKTFIIKIQAINPIKFPFSQKGNSKFFEFFFHFFYISKFEQSLNLAFFKAK